MSALPGYINVKCSYCDADEGYRCRTSSGAILSMPHNLRFDDRQRALRSDREFVVQIKRDDLKFGIHKGEYFAAVNYPYDSKVTLLRRLHDDFDPQCNQYEQDVEFIEWFSKKQ